MVSCRCSLLVNQSTKKHERISWDLDGLFSSKQHGFTKGADGNALEKMGMFTSLPKIREYTGILPLLITGFAQIPKVSLSGFAQIPKVQGKKEIREPLQFETKTMVSWIFSLKPIH